MKHYLVKFKQIAVIHNTHKMKEYSVIFETNNIKRAWSDFYEKQKTKTELKDIKTL